MTWFAAGAAVVGTAVSLYSANSAASAQASQAGAMNSAQGANVVRERTGKMMQNAYSTAFSQMQLALQKRQASTQVAGIKATELAASGTAQAVAAATGSIGASTDAIMSDIKSRAGAAVDQTRDAFENAVDNYNQKLTMMVINTDASAPAVNEAKYAGPSSGEMLGGALLGGLAQFAGNYAKQKMQLGLGTPSGQYNGPITNGEW